MCMPGSHWQQRELDHRQKQSTCSERTDSVRSWQGPKIEFGSAKRKKRRRGSRSRPLSALIVCARGSIRKAATATSPQDQTNRRASRLGRLRHTHNVTYCLPAAIILCRYIILERNIPSAAGGGGVGGGEGVRLTSNLYSIRLAGLSCMQQRRRRDAYC